MRARQRRRIAPLLCAVIAAVLLLGVSIPAYASNAAMEGERIARAVESDFLRAISVYYREAIDIALPMAALSIAVSSFRILIENTDKAFEKAKAQVKYTLIAVVVLILIPSFVAAGVSFGERYGWNP